MDSIEFTWLSRHHFVLINFLFTQLSRSEILPDFGLHCRELRGGDLLSTASGRPHLCRNTCLHFDSNITIVK